MNKKMFLTSAIAMGFVVPAFAEPFPSDGYMEENKTYDEAATFENTGVYDGEVDATAEYEDIFYDIVAGNYLAAGSDDEDGTICPTGFYCSGLTHALYNATSDQGKTSCPTDYALSAAGAKTADECYRQCTSADVANSKSTGTFTGMFYSNNTNACEPVNNASCANGYHYKAGLNIEDTIGNTEGENSAYINASGSFGEMNYDGLGAKGQTYYGITDNMSWAVDYGDKGFLYGQARCSTVEGVRDFDWGTNTLNQPITTHTTAELGAEGGKYCYCNVTGYKNASGALQSLSSSWVFRYGKYDASLCASNCAYNCAAGMRTTFSDSLAFRAALLGSVGASPAMCAANTITINWDDVDPEYAGQNNEGTATYGEDVRTPVKANTYKGKTFKGWKFSKPTTTNLPE